MVKKQSKKRKKLTPLEKKIYLAPGKIFWPQLTTTCINVMKASQGIGKVFLGVNQKRSTMVISVVIWYYFKWGCAMTRWHADSHNVRGSTESPRPPAQNAPTSERGCVRNFIRSRPVAQRLTASEGARAPKIFQWPREVRLEKKK